MKKHFLLASLAFISITYLEVRAQGNSINTINISSIEVLKNGEKIFLKHADRGLAFMEQAAKELKIEGVAVMVFIPGEQVGSGVSKMKVVGDMTRKNENFLAVANSKIAEMADTHLDSGSKIREPFIGETGWRGGLVKKVDSGYIMAAFSGGSEDEDIVVAKAGLEHMLRFY
ncbi:MAG TPA: hypothetical protein VLZ54_10520 [Arenibacter sp.]|nr:hypothetical protein [Arenibacter sp.]